MKKEEKITFEPEADDWLVFNWIQFIIAVLFTFVAIGTGFFTKTPWNVMFGLMAAGYARLIYVDDYYGESVRSFKKRLREYRKDMKGGK